MNLDLDRWTVRGCHVEQNIIIQCVVVAITAHQKLQEFSANLRFHHTIIFMNKGNLMYADALALGVKTQLEGSSPVK